ncbi:MAG: hypothetical protein M1827_001093 [Pycnora praestabilis]|nr:MAG: hypothetical protein M1827_001093 [Pycnora praestabilis]
MAQHYAPPGISPPQSTPSPGAPSPSGSYIPPSKRQRLSPNPTSPYGMGPNSPNFSNISLPNPSQPLSNMPGIAAPATTGIMGPPSRPVEKATDTTELTDVLASSGIDIKDEEAALTNSYYQQPQSTFQPNNASSFNSTTSNGSNSSTISASTSYNNLSQSQPGQGAVFGPGAHFKSALPGAISDEDAKNAARRLNDSRQHHLSDSFLYGHTLRQKIYGRTYENGVQMPLDGLYDAVGTAAKGGSLVDRDASMADILSLLSLAANERLRGLVEDAAALAKGRQVGSHGLVPPEWSDIATGIGAELATASSAQGGRNGWESAVSPLTMAIKRSYSSANAEDAKSAMNTINFPNQIAQSLRNLSQQERSSEELRHVRRSRRAANGSVSGEGSKASIPVPGNMGGPLSTIAPDFEGKRPTKKEQQKQANAKADEAYAHSSANKTAGMMLGGGGFGRKKGGYSWLNPGGGSGASAPRINTAMGGSVGAEGTGPGPGANVLLGGGKRIGEWREDREKGVGIQLRDWVSVLEADGKEKRSLACAYARMKSKE